MPMTGRDVVTEALLEMGALGVEETAEDAIAVFALGKLNRIFDNWNAERAAVYADAFSTYTLTPSLSPHLIGPTGTFVVTSRPETIDGAAIVYTGSTPNIEIPITIRDAQWWQQQRVKALASSIPTDLFYEPDWPNGKLFFWPVPDTAYGVTLRTRILLAALALADTFTMPPGYHDATVLTLAEDLCEPLGKAMPAGLSARAAKARARVFQANAVTPRLVTRAAGLPRGPRGRIFNPLTREM